MNMSRNLEICKEVITAGNKSLGIVQLFNICKRKLQTSRRFVVRFVADFISNFYCKQELKLAFGKRLLHANSSPVSLSTVEQM